MRKKTETNKQTNIQTYQHTNKQANKQTNKSTNQQKDLCPKPNAEKKMPWPGAQVVTELTESLCFYNGEGE